MFYLIRFDVIIRLFFITEPEYLFCDPELQKLFFIVYVPIPNKL